ncbi:MAG TPA: HAD family hydrolase [Syntrophales bacterium]|nr:HAD family hydrolase [Syntrophales bacterium]HOL59694.1 HAD family hydrolase [Syntrophales bacterium]HPO35840.1 HAD family hydrolase [Syntrophales bacterium]
MKISGFIFDFDGTLTTLKVDFSRMRKEVVSCLEAYSIPQEVARDKYILEMVEAGFEYLCDVKRENAEAFRRQAFEIIEKLEVSAAQIAKPIEGVVQMLKSLRTRGMRTAVVTRNCLQAVTIAFPSLSLLVDAVLARDQVKQTKPHLNHLAKALKAIGTEAKEAVMVGDHPMDIMMGKEGGLMAVGVLTGSGRREDFLAAGADYVLASAADLLDLLDRMTRRI